MAFFVSLPQGHHFPAGSGGGGGSEWNIDDCYWTFTATSAFLHIPYNPAAPVMYAEWTQVGDWTESPHQSYAIVVPEGTAAGDELVKELTGFEPDSTWFFRAIATDGSSPMGEQ